MISFISAFINPQKHMLKKYQSTLDIINKEEDDVRGKTIEELKEEIAHIKTSLQNDEKTIDEVLPRVFAIVREASRKVLGMRHFDVQLIAGMALHKGAIAEQKTGEGKTLTASAPLFLNALSGKGAHLVTVNDYLVRRDGGWMGALYHSLGLSTGIITTEGAYIYDPTFDIAGIHDQRLKHLRPCTKKEAYDADITYGINSEFGFDYLRDNMATNPSALVQRGFNFSIVDEADSVLIDEARTPHIISAPVEDDVSRFYTYAQIVKQLKPEHYEVDEKKRSAHLTEEGLRAIEQMTGIANMYETDFDSVFYIEAALKAQTLFKNDRDYIVRDGEVIIVDEFTGRLLPGRRYSEGLHQAIEAKEGVPIQRESRTLATVSLQNYFRMYKKLSGMTGTASTEAEEFSKIYGIDVLVVPTNMPNIRIDLPDNIYKTMRSKYQAVAEHIAEMHKVGRPVLVGTTSIEHNQELARALQKLGVPHNVLNAKNHEMEAEIIANAGKKGAVTVATNMAGRGVDIILGGNAPQKPEGELSEKDEKKFDEALKNWQREHDEVVSLGGLAVIGTERHESRRIDNQLRGRAGRQGDPGETQFFISLEDDLMRIFGGDRLKALFNSPLLNVPDDMPLSHSMVSSAIEQAQVKVEGHNFDQRKHLVEYDDVLTKQREIIYKERGILLEKTQDPALTKEKFFEIFTRFYADIENSLFLQKPEEEQAEGVVDYLHAINPLTSKEQLKEIVLDGTNTEFNEYVMEQLNNAYKLKEKELGEHWPMAISVTLLQTIDDLWSKHLTSIEHLREGIGLRGYAQLDPLVEYKKESFRLFEELMKQIDEMFVRQVLHMHIRQQGESTQEEAPKQHKQLSAEEAKYAHLDEKSREKLLKKQAKKHKKK